MRLLLVYLRVRPRSECVRCLSLFHSRKSDDESKTKTPSDPVKVQTPAKDAAAQSVAPTSPSYFGYLSGVASTLWKSGYWLSDISAQLASGTASAAAPAKGDSEKSSTKIIVHKVSRSEIVKRTRNLVFSFLAAQSTKLKVLRIEELNRHLMSFPASRLVAVQNSFLIPRLRENVRQSSEEPLGALSRQCLTLCGCTKPPRGRGVNVLAIDGGGTRGMMGLEILKELEKCAGGKKISDLFDIIVGVSTGAIIATLLGALRLNVDEATNVYMEISKRLFDQGKFSGVSGLLLSHSYYNTTKWVEILKETLGADFHLIETARDENCPKLAIVSCVVNATQLQPFVFRNYEHPVGGDSHYRGSTEYKCWQAIQASAAAPGYFQEVLLGSVLHQDGGVLVNNPTGIALHETRLLWPNERLQAVVSVGNGRNVTEIELSTANSTWVHEKLSKIVDSATDTELVHSCIYDLLPVGVYYRLNPYMSTPYTLDEVRLEKLAQMSRDAKLYVRRNRRKIEAAALQLTKRPTWLQTLRRNISQWKEGIV